ncbi:MAG: hypothetical protein COU47_00665 [Candidatus Niyogibacteria bacterium CG10_big_fil_rev_8_21_14_0_10_46_36]|uniref:VTC domain-containing protein n=1 Tax=Candidatus Niyogibacteria bacterium CG10_big_fil_rev_8_21_14_0_10_46_36 TaxID=1974726 RepID=A0A2H0TEG3_9BACT|nr:MAG: hypothetical protein COU47_00665 [Candidatus Niyogibacteria bacterium CG10_big_fil_rev_8_21_14_0_10_46_36]
MLPKLHFQRFEFKYLLSPQQEFLIKKRIKPFMSRDPRAAESQTGSYEIWSLYYDSPRYFYYHEKKDGVRKRKKIRWRAYKQNGVFSENIFFEIKRKDDAIILKDRIYVSKKEYALFAGREEDTLSEKKDNVIQEFLSEKLLRSIAPEVLVVYEREPFVGSLNENVRITFDRNIRARKHNSLIYEGEDFVPVLQDKTVMEVKFNGKLPFYLHEVIREFNLHRMSYSKYCESLDASRKDSIAFSLRDGII